MIIACLQIGYISSFLVTFYSILYYYIWVRNICTFDFEECILIYHKKLDQIASHQKMGRTYQIKEDVCGLHFFSKIHTRFYTYSYNYNIPQHAHHLFIHDTPKYLNLLQIEKKTNLGCFFSSHNCYVKTFEY